MAAQALAFSRMGLSPRMRGNRAEEGRLVVFWGSIPAHAGEPRSKLGPLADDGVYPRACGGTLVELAGQVCLPGLSPRMRGNHLGDAGPGASEGSIPAHAGEPGTCRGAAGPPRVYPRACGGTLRNQDLQQLDGGLSPRMRGNLSQSSLTIPNSGSIPAHAGEPDHPSWTPCPRRVYPRACGGTVRPKSSAGRSPGLSPRMRGNLLALRVPPLRHGSIPAHAGEPPPLTPPHGPLGVYPRACGGTFLNLVDGRSSEGLSPRMRGNPCGICAMLMVMGSIPAHAGEPRWLRCG